MLDDLKSVKSFDKEQFIEAHQLPASTSIRLNPRKPIHVFDTLEKVPWCDNGRYLLERPIFTLDPLYHAGGYYVQEASSMFLHHVLKQLLPSGKTIRVLDLCAAPGGKSTLIASILSDDSLLVSNEVIRGRASILQENVIRWGHMNNWVTSNDPSSFSRLEGFFDVILVDAPCSGSGLFRKDAKAIDEWSENVVAMCSKRQHRILEDIWPALKKGGILIYATCSYSPMENESVLDWVGDTFQAQSIPIAYDFGWGIQETVSDKHSYYGYRFFPYLLKGEGFFISAFEKREDVRGVKVPIGRSLNDAAALARCKHYLEGNWICIRDKDGYSAIHPCQEHDLHILEKTLYFRSVGCSLGQPVKTEWIPAHDVALSTHRSGDIPIVKLGKEAALKFLKKEDFGIGDLARGWYLVTYDGLALGWIKALGSRINNYLPKNWRIRMDITDEE